MPSVAATCEIGWQITRALRAVESSGLIHRDIKPSNVMLTAGESGLTLVKVLDFGLAGWVDRCDAMSSPMGTAGYAAPEQLCGQSVDFRSDLYALGVTLIQLLLGEHPVGVDRSLDPVRQALSAAVQSQERWIDRRPDVPQDLAAMLRSMSAMRPDDRPAKIESPMAVFDRYRAALTYPPMPDVDVPDVDLSGVLLNLGKPQKPRRRGAVKWFVAAGLVASLIWTVRPKSTANPTTVLSETVRAASWPGSNRTAIASDIALVRGSAGYAPFAPGDRVLEVDFRGHGHHPEKVRLAFEATPGRYVLRVRADRRGRLSDPATRLFFCQNGDRGVLSAGSSTVQTAPLAVRTADQPPEVAFNVTEGTQKISVQPAWRPPHSSGSFEPLANTHTVIVLFAYADLVPRDATLNAERVHAGDRVMLRLTIQNVGTVNAPASELAAGLTVAADGLGAIDGRVAIPAIDAGGSRAVEMTIPVPRSLPPGGYFVVSKLDVADAVLERDELSVGQWRFETQPGLLPAGMIDLLVPPNNTSALPLQVISPTEVVPPADDDAIRDGSGT